MNTSHFRSLFPNIVTDSIANDLYLDRVFEKLNSFPENVAKVEKHKITTDENLWKIEIPLPGASKEDVKISLKDTDKLAVEVINEDSWSKDEKREFKLPTSADADSITAEMKNGLLTMTISKKKSFQDKVVKVK
jgi:HSP20 family molecular chaperone IbpA